MRRSLPCLFVAPLCLAALSATCAFAAESPGQRTQSMLAVSNAAASGMPAVPAAALDRAVDRAATLSGINVDAMARATEVRLRLSRATAFGATFDAAGTNLRIALPNTLVLPSLQTMAVGTGSVVTGVTAKLASMQPQFVTNVDIALSANAGAAIRFEKETLIVSITPGAVGITGTIASPADLAMARIEETVHRDDDALATSNATMNQAIENAGHGIEQADLALLQAQLAHATSADKVRADFRSREAQTAMLETERATLLAQRSDALQTARRSLASAKNVDTVLASFEKQEQQYGAALQALAARAKQQYELNTILAQRVQGEVVGATHGTAAASLDQVNAALDTVRIAALDAKAPVALAAAPRSEVAKANIALDVQTKAPLAVLSDTTAANLPPAPRVKAPEHRISMDSISRGGTMAVLRSTPGQVANAEQNGVIKLAQAQPAAGTGITEVKPAPAPAAKATEGPRRYSVPKTTGTRPAFNLYNPNVPASQDPLRQIVNLDFQGMDLTNVVSLLAEKGQINVIAGTDVTGTVTANLKNVPLGRAIEIVLRMNGYGIVEEAGVYRITTYEEAMSSQRQTRMIFLKNAQAEAVKKTLDDVLGSNAKNELVSISANSATNVIIIAGPLEAIEELEGVVAELDVAEQVVPTITMPIKLNYSDPLELVPVVTPLISKDGKVASDQRTRQIIVSDIPVKVQEIQALIKSIDLPVRSIGFDAMVVDAKLEDGAMTGVDWLLSARDTMPDPHPNAPAAPAITAGSALPITNPQAGLGLLGFGIISNAINLRATVNARVESTDSELLAEPYVVTVENKEAEINISNEIPYQELTQTSEGGQIASTKFKDVGTVLKVTPRVTHDDHVLVKLDAKQSNTTGESVTGVPVEAKRTVQNEVRLKNGQSFYVGGLRSHDSTLKNRKVPIVGDIPILNVFFKSQDVSKKHQELMVFVTCNILPDDKMPDLTPYQQERYDELGGIPNKVNGTRDLVRTYTHPEEQRDPIYKWRRTK